MRVLVYPDGDYAELGARRWAAEWYLVKPDALGKDEIDHDRDIEFVLRSYPTRAKARAAAMRALKHPRQAYGDARIREQVVVWMAGVPRMAEWEDVGEPEYMV